MATELTEPNVALAADGHSNADEIGPVPQRWHVGLAEYHRDRSCESNSTLTAFAQDSWEYYLRYVKQCLPPKLSSPEQDFGTATHLAICAEVGLIDADAVAEQVIVIPDDKTRDSAAGKRLKERHPNEPVLSNADVSRLALVVKSVLANPEARKLLERGGEVEHAIRWLHASGIWLKASFDLLQDDGLALDIKTSANPKPRGYHNFTWAVKNYGYYRQAALYAMGRDLYRPYEGFDGCGYKWLVVGTGWPYDVRIYTPDDVTLALGRDHNERILEALAARLQFADFGEHVWRDADHGRELIVSLSPYGYYDDVGM